MIKQVLCTAACSFFFLSATAYADGEPPIIPVITPSQATSLRAVMNSPLGLTRHRNVFIKIGDSITATGSYVVDIGCFEYESTDPGTIMDINNNFASSTALIPTARFFSARNYSPSFSSGAWCANDHSNSFTRASSAAESGMTASFGVARTLGEINAMNPSFALVMFGTNDVLGGVEQPLQTALATYTEQMNAIISICLENGVVPVLSTIPPLFPSRDVPAGAPERVAAYNNEIINLTATRGVPIWNYHAALMAIGSSHGFGMDPDGIHPNIYLGSQGANFSSTALNYGYNVRNKTALEVLQALRTALLDTVFESGFE